LRSRRGLTLIEVIIAVLIVVVAIIPVFDMISGATRGVASVEEETTAFALTTEASEWLKALSYNELRYKLGSLAIFPKGSMQAVDGGVVFLENSIVSYEAGGTQVDYEPAEQFKIYKRRSHIFAPSISDGSIKVEVEVSWESRMKTASEGIKHQVKLQFFRYEI
jgi:prepilin-type N-terminal cleavage/methylation domain-containing protein